jgi:opacity protein-like surface antigen
MRWCALFALVSCAGLARAQDAAEAKADAEAVKAIRTEKWIVGFELNAWYGGPGGDVILPGGGEKVSLSDLNLDSPRLSPAGELHLWSGDWRFSLGGSYIQEENRGSIASFSGQLGSVPFSVGDTLEASLNFWEAEATVGKLIRLPENLAGDGRNFSSNLEVFGGMRLYGVDFDFAAPSGSTSSSETFGLPLIGIKYSMNIVECFTIDVQFDIGYFTDGGDKSTLGYDIMAGFMWRPTQNIGVQIGYRDLAYSLQSGSGSNQFEWEGSIQGLYAGAAIRF